MFGFTSDQNQKSEGRLTSLRQKLSKTRNRIVAGISNPLLNKKKIDTDVLEQLEDQLLMADIGFQATQTIISQLTEQLQRKQLQNDEILYATLQQIMADMLKPCEQSLELNTDNKPFIILMVGVNGVGKTTTVSKLAQQFKSVGHQVMLAAGDTFRAAAVEQLQSWGDRLAIPVIKQAQGADSASVIFDALQSAKARKIDILIADTAGRLHTQNSLMDELKKIKRVMTKLDLDAPHEVLLVLDATTGQNAIAQAEHFKAMIGVSGIVLTKLDGSAKGGVIFSIATQLKLPIRYIGVGESVTDLRPFNSQEFVHALLGGPLC